MNAIDNGPMTIFQLSGVLGKKFGKEHKLYVSSPKEGIKAMCTVLSGFEQFMTNAHRQGLTFAIFKNKRNINKDELSDGSGGKIVRIVPVVMGSKRGGMLQTIIGAVIIAAAIYFSGGAAAAFSSAGTMGGGLALAGASLMVGGVIQMLSPQPKGLSMREGPENKPSYAFGGAVNTTMQGNPVGVLYGEREIGGAVISAGIYTEDKQ